MEAENKINLNSVLLDDCFLNKYLVDAKGDYIKVYIYLNSKGEDSIFSISKNLSLELSKVCEAVEYWEKENMLEQSQGNVRLIVLNKNNTFSFGERLEYDPLELKMYCEKNEDVKALFDMTQRKIGRLLTPNDLSGIFGIYSRIGLSIPVIDRLLTYCVDNNHRNMKYIEKVAVDWAENSILTPDAADEKIRMYNEDFRRIMRSMGQSVRNPVSKEEQYMIKWIKEYKLPLEVIEYACEKTVLNTGKASFAYADKILTSWKEEDVRSVEEATNLENKFSSSKKEKVETKTQGNKKNRFVNFEQRSYDYDEYERMELERISKKNNSVGL